jgi:CDP-diacylglycerol--glycerol-3-phosphate 3-phosphatidyltransferase
VFVGVKNHKNIILLSIFTLVSITDYLDGALARRWDVTSTFGAFLDPVADKIAVSTALILLSGKCGSIVSIPTTIILAREISVSALREWMAQRSMRDVVGVGRQGKLKTALTMISISLLLATLPSNPPFVSETVPWKFGICLLYLSTILTLTSGLAYFKAAIQSSTE